MRAKTPTIHCDADDGDCGTWDIDEYASSCSSVDGVAITADHPAVGWLSTDLQDLCPAHAAMVRRPVVHAAPTHRTGTTPCCGRTPFEVPRSDRTTTDHGSVTCIGAREADHG